jgi:hypothetical protein
LFFGVCGRTLVRVKGQLAGGGSTKQLVWVASLVRVKGQWWVSLSACVVFVVLGAN